MYYSFGMICFGASLLLVALGLYFVEQQIGLDRLLAHYAANTIIDPENPPKIVIQKMPTGGVRFHNAGGAASFTEGANASAAEQIQKDLAWLLQLASVSKFLGYFILVLGLADAGRRLLL